MKKLFVISLGFLLTACGAYDHNENYTIMSTRSFVIDGSNLATGKDFVGNASNAKDVMNSNPCVVAALNVNSRHATSTEVIDLSRPGCSR